MSRTNGIWLICLILSFGACKESKYLGTGQYIYSANKIDIKSSEKISKSKTKALKTELKTLLRPRLNGKLLGFRFKLWVYNIAGHPKKSKGFRHWLKYKVGEPPVLSSTATIEKNREIFQNHLENKGYFHDTVTVETPVKNKHLTAVYTAEIGPQYTIRNIEYPSDSDAFSKQLANFQKRSLIQKNKPYDLDIIKAERERIDARLKQRGYYFFNPNYLVVDVDSTVGQHKVDMELEVKEETPPAATSVWRINDIVVYANYGIHSDTSLSKAGTFEGYKIVDSAKLFRSLIYSRNLVFKPGDIYSRDKHNLALNRLVSLGVFKFVKVRYIPADTTRVPSDTGTNNKLNMFFYLTPGQKKSIRFEVSGLTRDDNSTGGEVALSWRNRNIFRGAELFTATVYAGLEEQYLGANQKIATRRGGIDLNLFIPRIISPFKWSTNSGFVPKTKISAGYGLFDRSKEYTLISAKGSFGYIFKENIETEHQLTLANINYVRPTNIDPSFQHVLDTNIMLARSIEQQFIIGSIYNFNYNTQARPNRNRNNFYFNGNVDVSGNWLGLVTGANINKGKQVVIFNIPFAQYVRLEADFRHYLSFGQYSMLASRVTGGAGISYGNSTTMPFIKEFFAGGTNDIRAFRSRALGPGSYNYRKQGTVLIPDQPGDIKLVAQAEYRTRLFSIVRWALFVDAGNIWTLRTDSSRPGSKFSSSFLNDVAVGVGTGLRFDLRILVLRVDVAVPIRHATLTEGSKWAFNKATDISNLVLNLAIGYPF